MEEGRPIARGFPGLQVDDRVAAENVLFLCQFLEGRQEVTDAHRARLAADHAAEDSTLAQPPDCDCLGWPVPRDEDPALLRRVGEQDLVIRPFAEDVDRAHHVPIPAR
jgi:hypothetical protein